MIIKREGVCPRDGTVIKTGLEEIDDERRFCFGRLVGCPVCAGEIDMVKVISQPCDREVVIQFLSLVEEFLDEIAEYTGDSQSKIGFHAFQVKHELSKLRHPGKSYSPCDKDCSDCPKPCRVDKPECEGVGR